MPTITITIDCWEAAAKAYALGAYFAAHHFVRKNPGWYDKLAEGALYTVLWPYSLAKEFVFPL